MLYFTNYEVLIAISNIMKEVINDEKIDTISKFYNLDAQMVLSEVNIFTTLCMQCRRGLAMRILSVRLSRRALLWNGRKIYPYFIPYERSFSLVFWEEEWVGGGDPFYLKFWLNQPPSERNRRFSTDIRL